MVGVSGLLPKITIEHALWGKSKQTNTKKGIIVIRTLLLIIQEFSYKPNCWLLAHSLSISFSLSSYLAKDLAIVMFNYQKWIIIIIEHEGVRTQFFSMSWCWVNSKTHWQKSILTVQMVLQGPVRSTRLVQRSSHTYAPLLVHVICLCNFILNKEC